MRAKGRKSKLTPELIAKISTEIENGSYLKVAARKCGVGESTFYAWMENAEGGVCGQFQELMEAIKNALQKNLFLNVKKNLLHFYAWLLLTPALILMGLFTQLPSFSTLVSSFLVQAQKNPLVNL